MTRRLVTAAILVAAVLIGRDAAAQSSGWDGRVILSGNGGGQVSSTDFTDSATFTDFQEEGTFEAEYAVASGPTFDGGVGVRLWGNLGAGVTVAGFTHKDTGSFALRAPHPFFFNRHREFSGEIEDLERKEIGAHIQALYMVPLTAKLRLLVSAGPSFFQVEQDIIEGVDYGEAFPFDALVNPEAVVTNRKKNVTGYNVGADVTWMLGSRWGVGGLLRYSRGSADFDVESDTGDTREVSVDVGGLQVGGGIRLFF